MCETERGERPWQLYIRDMIDFGEKVLAYTGGLDQDEFVAEGLIYDATLRNIELIGVAATHIPFDVREAHSEIEWRQIIGMRNQLAHVYLGLDDDVIWDVICTDIPRLLQALRTLLDKENEEGK